MDPDRELIDRAATRDPAAIDALLERHMPALYAFVRVRAGPLVQRLDSPDDIVQSVCRDVLGGLQDFEYRGEAAFRHWLYRRAYRKILDRHDYWTAQKRDARREVAPAPSQTDHAVLECYRTFCTPSRDLIAREALDRIEAAIDDLPEDRRQAIALHRLVGLSVTDIAAEMGRTEGAVRNLIYRGLARIALALAEDQKS